LVFEEHPQSSAHAPFREKERVFFQKITAAYASAPPRITIAIIF